MEIGGFFPYEKNSSETNGYIDLVCPDAGDVRHLMSGRCAIYFCLQDSMLTDTKRTAYLPAYTCETVSGCFVKAGYKIYYYDVDHSLVPQFDDSLIDKISFLLICGYYGFSTFDTDFVRACRNSGVTVMQDTTHTAFSPSGPCPDTDYIAVSLRKWMGVASGGLAFKRAGRFGVSPVPADEEHLKIRDSALRIREEYERTEDEALNKRVPMRSGKQNGCCVKSSTCRKATASLSRRSSIIRSRMPLRSAVTIMSICWSIFLSVHRYALFSRTFRRIPVLCSSPSSVKTGNPS